MALQTMFQFFDNVCVSFQTWYFLDVFVKCIGAIVNVCAICDVVYYDETFLTLCENTKVSNYYNRNCQTDW